MFMKLFVPVLLVVASAVTPAFSLPVPSVPTHVFCNGDQGNNSTAVDLDNSTVDNLDNSTVQVVLHLNDTAAMFPEMEPLLEGNQVFRSIVASSTNPSFLKDLATNEDKPEFMFLGCSDSRVPESTIFSAPPGSFLTQRNIANQFQPIDNNAISVLSLGVQELGVGHVVVMGHYGCGGVRAAMSPRPNTTGFSQKSVQAWINPIRATYLNSTRPEIVSYREANENNTAVPPPGIDDPAFRALVEENVKDSVYNIVLSPMMQQHWSDYVTQEQAQNDTSSSLPQDDTSSPPPQRRDTDTDAGAGAPLKPVYVHGFVYDTSTGDVIDLGVSFGPYGLTTQAPPPPQGALKRAVNQQAHGHAHL